MCTRCKSVHVPADMSTIMSTHIFRCMPMHVPIHVSLNMQYAIVHAHICAHFHFNTYMHSATRKLSCREHVWSLETPALNRIRLCCTTSLQMQFTAPRQSYAIQGTHKLVKRCALSGQLKVRSQKQTFPDYAHSSICSVLLSTTLY